MTDFLDCVLSDIMAESILALIEHHPWEHTCTESPSPCILRILVCGGPKLIAHIAQFSFYFPNSTPLGDWVALALLSLKRRAMLGLR